MTRWMSVSGQLFVADWPEIKYSHGNLLVSLVNFMTNRLMNGLPWCRRARYKRSKNLGADRIGIMCASRVVWSFDPCPWLMETGFRITQIVNDGPILDWKLFYGSLTITETRSKGVGQLNAAHFWTKILPDNMRNSMCHEKPPHILFCK